MSNEEEQMKLIEDMSKILDFIEQVNNRIPRRRFDNDIWPLFNEKQDKFIKLRDLMCEKKDSSKTI